ncbi:ribonuclease H, type 2 [Natrialba magadii ATCC 43099]|uniref:Ribonuclease HII n=1 Tax=Natrialba magadii (strain ATCC 43099 / DSM 3394 / CCM 3739 / CIP 104546 / IAM 13178 / JCM 8861 / NBRC 102185 / NCIMB 2190 / MS3) TaxID=547559 RepID=D3SZ69_NATMM|nr:ribonuclease HII [Natrialba magadii]ADD06261.1 ribonuclease H, type 2 [Natrialba magadii ATCC 43099]ELY31305.1 ribonuclease HII [Natrialba magadii ATCC 43099]
MPIGVDEAGKGPVLGSMFAAAVHVERETVLPDGIADSKRLTPARRDELAATLREDDRIGVGVAEITTAQIDDPETDMNSLSVRAHAEAIEAVAADTVLEAPITGLCDACDTDADRFARRVADRCGLECTISAEHGADDDSPIVGAASIIAKVERDTHVESVSAAFPDCGPVGSGYPSDPNTRAFLESYVDAHGELPACARESWSTCEDVLAAAEQTGLGQF